MKFPDLCEYYNALRELPVARYAKLYVARWWPVLLPVEGVDDYGNAKESFPNDVKITTEDGPLSERLILQLAGVGEYRFRLNDMRRPWKQQTVVFSEAEWIDPTLWTLHPPIIEPKRLDLDAKRNQAYIKFARAHGYLPREGEQEKEQADMAEATVVQTVMQDARAERARADQLQREALDRAEREARELKAASEKERAAKPVEPPRPTSDLEAMGGVIVSLVNAVKPNPDNSLSEYLKLEAAREETRRATDKAERDALRESASKERERVEKLQDEILADLRKAPAVVTPPAPPTRRQMLEDAVAEQQLLKQLAGRGGPQQEETEKPSSIDKWLEAAPIIAPVISQFVGGIFQTIHFGLTTWQQISYNAALTKNGSAEPKPPTTMEKPPEPGKPLAPQGPTPTPEQQAQQAQWSSIMGSVQALAPYLIDSLDEGESGAEFAEFIIKRAPEKRTSYERIKHLADSLTMIGMTVPGASDLEKFMNAARFSFEKVPNLWAKVGTLPTMSQFLSDFFNYDEILAEEEKRSATQTE